jgi:hypothetical protein
MVYFLHDLWRYQYLRALILIQSFRLILILRHERTFTALLNEVHSVLIRRDFIREVSTRPTANETIIHSGTVG